MYIKKNSFSLCSRYEQFSSWNSKFCGRLREEQKKIECVCLLFACSLLRAFSHRGFWFWILPLSLSFIACGITCRYEKLIKSRIFFSSNCCIFSLVIKSKASQSINWVIVNIWFFSLSRSLVSNFILSLLICGCRKFVLIELTASVEVFFPYNNERQAIYICFMHMCACMSKQPCDLLRIFNGTFYYVVNLP